MATPYGATALCSYFSGGSRCDVVADRLAYLQASMQNRPVPKLTKSNKSIATYSVGIDLGGTKVSAALVDDQGRLLTEVRKPTVPPWLKDQDPRNAAHQPKPREVQRHIDYVVSTMADAVLEASQPVRDGLVKGRIIGVGLASAGPMNIEKGTLEYPANFRGWKKIPLVKLLSDALRERKIKGPLAFQNDAMAAALGEGWIGVAKGKQTYAMITVGTGIGSGVIFNGRPAQSSGMGSEWGHLLVNSVGSMRFPETLYERTVEGLASGTGIVRRAKAKGLQGETAADLARAAREGNLIAREIFTGASEGLAALFYGLSLGFHPDMLVVTGGLLGIKDLFLPQAIELYKELIRLRNPEFSTPIRVSKLGNRAGVIGAARLPRLM